MDPGPVARDARIVVIGAGHGAVELAATLRRGRHVGPIVLIGDEPHLPYERPALSKAVLCGAEPAELRSAKFYASQQIELRPATSAVRIDREARAVELATGERVGFDALVLATGSSPRGLSGVACEDAPLCVRSLADARALRQRLPGRLLVIGGGYLGLEIAASARSCGAEVDVVEAGARLLQRVAPEPIAAAVAALHAKRGVRCWTGAEVRSLRRAGAETEVLLADGRRWTVDLVVAAIGGVPRDELAVACGLDVAGGVLVDAAMRSSDPDIFAIGDVARQRDAGRAGRLESIAAALAQARAAAAALLGAPPPRAELPWFWSDQYGSRLQSVGLAAPDAEARTVQDGRALVVLQFEGGRTVAAHAFDAPQHFLAAKRLVAAGAVRDHACAELEGAQRMFLMPPF